jgi:sigma-E factor negative regulatory protein RseC
MITEEGIVVEVKPNGALIRPDRTARCEGCVPQFCLSDQEGKLILEARDEVGVRVGQRVRVAIPDDALAWGGFVLYGLPLIGLVTGAVIGKTAAALLGWNAFSDGLAVVCSLLFMLGVFVWVKRYSRRIEKGQRLRPMVIQVLGSDL